MNHSYFLIFLTLYIGYPRVHGLHYSYLHEFFDDLKNLNPYSYLFKYEFLNKIKNNIYYMKIFI